MTKTILTVAVLISIPILSANVGEFAQTGATEQVGATGESDRDVQIEQRRPNETSISGVFSMRLHRDSVRFKEVPPYSGANIDRCRILETASPFMNCHGFVMDKKRRTWCNDPYPWLRRKAIKLSADAPRRQFDIVVYGNDRNGDGLRHGEIEHTGFVVQVDSLGNVERVLGKWGEEEIHVHHPADPQAKASYGLTREYWRLKTGLPSDHPVRQLERFFESRCPIAPAPR